MGKEVQNWLDSSQYDLETAEAMFKSERFIYTVFMCHLALEKILKAKVQEIISQIPPKIHNLKRLLQLGQLSPDTATEAFISELNNMSVVTRYQSDFKNMRKDFSKQRVEKILTQTKEAHQWIKRFIGT